MRDKTQTTGLATGLGALALGLAVAGCSGGGGGGGILGVIPTPTPATTTFFASPRALNGGTARGYVALRGQVPVAVGMEMTDKAFETVPVLPAGQPQVTLGIPLPAQASLTPFVQIGMAYFTSHPPAGIGDRPHFHPLFLMSAPRQPDPPSFAAEFTPIAPAELPADNVVLPDLAPGIGGVVQDPTTPQARPGWNTIGQNYFFYNGHMNAIGLGATDGCLTSLGAKNASPAPLGDVIKQPTVYPKPGYYPHSYSVRYDRPRDVYVFELSDFRHS